MNLVTYLEMCHGKAPKDFFDGESKSARSVLWDKLLSLGYTSMQLVRMSTEAMHEIYCSEN